jgi:hypothetical protein
MDTAATALGVSSLVISVQSAIQQNFWSFTKALEERTQVTKLFEPCKGRAYVSQKVRFGCLLALKRVLAWRNTSFQA